jgi:hypothetical protein
MSRRHPSIVQNAPSRPWASPSVSSAQKPAASTACEKRSQAFGLILVQKRPLPCMKLLRDQWTVMPFSPQATRTSASPSNELRQRNLYVSVVVSACSHSGSSLGGGRYPLASQPAGGASKVGDRRYRNSPREGARSRCAPQLQRIGASGRMTLDAGSSHANGRLAANSPEEPLIFSIACYRYQLSHRACGQLIGDQRAGRAQGGARSVAPISFDRARPSHSVSGGSGRYWRVGFSPPLACSMRSNPIPCHRVR